MCIGLHAEEMPAGATYHLSLPFPYRYDQPAQWFASCTSAGMLAWEPNAGCQLTTVSEVQVTPRRKRGLMPVLTVLFVLSYCLMTLLIMEQAKTIESQRSLIQALFGDSLELTSIKGKAAEEKGAKARAEAQAKAQGQAQAVDPKSQQEQSKDNSRAGKTKRRMLEKPPKPAADGDDVRRTLLKT